MIGALAVCALGHIGYTLVPGAGPYATIHFDEPLRGGFWWHQVEVMVANAGAHLDIFPSLHTAYPTFFAIHVFAHRARPPYRYLWPAYAFFAANILVATMFLRWHWLIDVIAGVALALFARQLALIVTRREGDRGEEDDRQPVWEPIFGPIRPRASDSADSLG
jgi:membrane-associated phospholipid phosphatase